MDGCAETQLFPLPQLMSAHEALHKYEDEVYSATKMYAHVSGWEENRPSMSIAIGSMSIAIGLPIWYSYICHSVIDSFVQDANLPSPLLREAYYDLINIIWRLYRVCKLVHGDLSEYNILYHEREVVIIDVSQSVDLDHPKALDFLREDCKHVNDFFKKSSIPTLTMRELFDFCVDPHVTDENKDATLDSLMEVRAPNSINPKLHIYVFWEVNQSDTWLTLIHC